MKILVVLFTLATSALTARGAEQRELPGTLSPYKRVIIVEERTADADRDYYFVTNRGHQKLGFVLPEDQRNQISNVAVTASWNAQSTRVALLVLYGTKLNEVLLFTRDATGKFRPITWRQPDAEAIYKQRTGRTIPRPGDGHDENDVGSWVDENTVRLVSGQDMQTGSDADSYTHLLATFKARIQGQRATLSDLQIVGPLSDQANEKFIKRWGSRYFSDAEQ